MKKYPTLLECITHPKQTRRRNQEIRAAAKRQMAMHILCMEALRKNDFDAAQEVLDKMIAEFPDDAGIHAHVAGNYNLKGDKVNFLKHIAISLALNPEELGALTRLTRFLVNENQSELARQVHERAWTVYAKTLRYFRTKPAEIVQEKERFFALLDRWVPSTSPQKD